MRKITSEVVGAFNNRNRKSSGNTMTDGTSLFLHGNKIAEWRENEELWITNAGWPSVTTRERLNGLDGVRLCQRRGVQYLNGAPWDGAWTRVHQIAI